MEIKRFWAMPTKNTFDCPPIGDFVRKYLKNSKISIDPFARNKQWATFTNDLNPATNAAYHMDALDFLNELYTKKIKADLIIFDPPYSLRQIKECYENMGRKMSQKESQNFYSDIRDAFNQVIELEGIALSFGWNSIGMGKKRGFEIMEILLVCHGRAHNDTICMAERKISHQTVMFE